MSMHLATFHEAPQPMMKCSITGVRLLPAEQCSLIIAPEQPPAADGDTQQFAETVSPRSHWHIQKHP